jgi:membrane fusion protein, heavy metal efflux system
MKKTLQFIILASVMSSFTAVVYSAEDSHKNHDHDEKHAGASDQHDETDAQDDDHDHNESTHDSDEKEQGHEEGGHEEDGHGEHGAGEHGAGEEGIKLSSEQLTLADIKVETLLPRLMNYEVYAPGEIKANGYTSYLVSPRVDSVVLRRHVALGDHVKKGQALVTLFSGSVADAQGVYHVAQAEWRRVQKLGRKAVGEKRFVAAQVGYETAYGRLSAFGLSEHAIRSLTSSKKPLGEYTLNAEIDGAVLTDDFRQGQRVEPGSALMELADERAIWAEARLAPTAKLTLPAGSKARVKVGDELFNAVVTQEAHTIDPQTRTRVVRLLINNTAHQLHPGMFADVFFLFATPEPVLAVPETALMRGADGDWTVFVEVESNQFKAQEVELGRSLGKWREIQNIQSGARVVFSGAFFVASQIAKGGFDPHNH